MLAHYPPQVVRRPVGAGQSYRKHQRRKPRPMTSNTLYTPVRHATVGKRSPGQKAWQRPRIEVGSTVAPLRCNPDPISAGSLCWPTNSANYGIAVNVHSCWSLLVIHRNWLRPSAYRKTLPVHRRLTKMSVPKHTKSARRPGRRHSRAGGWLSATNTA